MKKSIWFFTNVSTLLFIFVIGMDIFCSENEKSIDELRIIREELHKTIDQLQKDIDSIKTKNNDLNKDQTYNSGDAIDELRNKIRAIKNTIKEKLDTLQKVISHADYNSHTKKPIEEEIEIFKEEFTRTIKDLQKEIENLQEEISDAKANIEDELDVLQEAKEENRFNTSFVFCPRLMWLDKDPLRLLNKKDSNLISKNFSFQHNETFLLGFMNYYKIENGFRIGVDLSGGYKKFESDPFRTVIMDTIFNFMGIKDTIVPVNVDSIISLHAIPAQIGFVCEKVLSFPKWNIFSGFMIGGGALVIVKNNRLSAINNVFISLDDTTEYSNYSVVVAPSFKWDFHAGAAFEIAPKFHIGFDTVLLFSFAQNGFNGRTNDFVTFDPGIRLRLSVGGAG